MQTYLKNFLKNLPAKCKNIIKEIFNKFSEFKKHIKIVFKNTNIEYTTKRKLINF